MAYNNSTQSNGVPLPTPEINYRVLLAVCMSAFFLYINALLLAGFFKKEVFRRSMRYILFAYTLMSDCLYLLRTNVLLILAYFEIFIQIYLCLLILIVVSVHTFVYILIITTISSLPITIFISTYWASMPNVIHVENGLCSIDMLILQRWQSHLKMAVKQHNTTKHSTTRRNIVVLCYVQITNAARKASGESKKSSGKGLRMVILHGFQLFLCLTQLWCPFDEDSIMQIDFMLFIDVRYANDIIFIIVPRCLSSLVYGLRERKLFLMLKYYAVCGLFYKSSPVLAD